MDKSSFRKWLVEQKFTLNRGYSWMNIIILGVVAVTSLKTLLPGLIDSFWKAIIVGILGLFGLWFIGYLDRRYRFLHSEQNYTTETNPALMEIVNKVREENKGIKYGV